MITPLIAAILPAALPPDDEAGIELFETSIRPVLVERCYKCHGEKRQRSELRVDGLTALIAGGERGPSVVPGDPDASLLIRAIRYDDEELEMPPRGKLDDAVIADFERWITLGAPASPDFSGEPAPAGPPQPGEVFDLAELAKHWSFQPVRDPRAQTVTDADWPRGDVDRFLLASLEAEGLEHAPEADRRTLIRRLSFDLRGLPPTPDEVQRFLDDERPEAYERLVDELLASPHFGETWARHWLDLVRYAESKGHEFDYTIPNAHEYRDYVIRAINADVPFDRFVSEHLAGDLLEEPRPHPEEGWDESVLGTGFWFLGEEVHSPVDIRGDQVERVANQVDVLSKALLGLTVACARCHDHKFDPITQEDFYALAGYVTSSSYRQVRFETHELERELAARARAAREAGEDDARSATAVALGMMTRPLLARAGEEELSTAVEQPGHPLHAYAALRGAGADFSARAAGLSAEWAGLEHDAEAFLSGAQILLDFGGGGPLRRAPWLVDGVAFGDGPVSTGDVRVGFGPEPRVERVFAYPAAAYDPGLGRLTRPAGTEGEPSEINWDQAGRTIRTPVVTLERPKLYYLVRGGGHAVAVIDGHRMIKGPLHQRARTSWEAAGGRLHWVEQDLSDYVGHSVHVEITPRAGQELELLLVAGSEAAPPATELPLRAVRDALSSGAVSSEAELAALLEGLFAQAERFVATGRANGASAGDLARLAGWLLGDRGASLPPAIEASFPLASRTAPAILDGPGFDERLLIRGSHRSAGDVVPRRTLEVLGGKQHPVHAAGSGRAEFARRLTDPANPLLARVQVNRIWMRLFGRGLVRSVDNFGVSGEAPTHPELLDNLATRFVSEGWSRKALIRLLVTSSAYRMASETVADSEERDPTNRYYHRAPVRRLGAEAIRDAVLAVSGRLDRALYGPPVPIHLTPFLQGRGRPQSGPLDGEGRRSIYLSVRRNFLSPFLQAFDFPTPATTIGRRSASNVPAQALTLMNDPFVLGEARRWAEDLAGGDGEAGERLDAMYLSAFSRPPTDAERQAALGYLGSGEPERWADVAHVLFNVKEFVFLD
ncbi:MAG: PSD1 and planctomycete cytochrome C domain-containing protein [Planctomycetota bacterium]